MKILLYIIGLAAIIFSILLGIKALKFLIKSKKGLHKKDSRFTVSWFELIVCTVLIMYSMLLLGLFAWALLTSFKTGEDFDFNTIGWPKPFTFENYRLVFDTITVNLTTKEGSANIWQQFGNAALYAIGSAFFRVAATTMVAYCTAKYKHWLSTLIYNVVLITLAIPIVGNMASMLQITQLLQIWDTFQGMFIMNFAFNNIYFLIIHAAFKNLPWTYAEAAFIDGASHLRVFTKVYLPMILNLSASVFLLFFIEIWNEYQTPMIYLPSYPTIAYGLFRISSGSVLQEIAYFRNEGWYEFTPLIVATGVFSFSVIFAVFMAFKEKLMGNLTEGGIKG